MPRDSKPPIPLRELLIYASPCAGCGCGSYCHWDDLATPAEGMTAVEWADRASGITCQRCRCKGYKASRKV
jgi:hypothetical protein